MSRVRRILEPLFPHRGLHWALWFAAGFALCMLGVFGCSPESRREVLETLFEEARNDSEPAAVVRAPRRPAPATPTPTATPMEDGAAGAKGNDDAFKTWDDAVRLLPKDAVGNPDFVAAVDEKVIAPRPGIDPEATEPEVLSLDVELVPKSEAAFKVNFSHEKHGRWLACPNCHDGLFAKKAGATQISPDAVHSDGYCAACHGKVAFDVVSGCPLCHLQNMPRDASGAIDWDRAMADQLIAPRAGVRPNPEAERSFDLDVDMTPKSQPKFSAIFSHAAHGKWLTCNNCHPSLFPKDPAAPRVRGEDLHSRPFCGSCHGSVAFGINTDCGRCHPAFEKARHHQVGLDLDVQVTPKTQPGSPAVFSHKIHSRYIECAACHTGVYDVTSVAAKMTPTDITGGRYCAACHGKVASDLMSRCQRCHGATEAK